MEIEIYMIFEELVHRQKQFVELAGRFVVRGEVIFLNFFFFLNVQSNPPQKNFQTRRYLMILQHVMCV